MSQREDYSICHTEQDKTEKEEEALSEAQAGKHNRSTIDQLFTLRQLAEKYTEYNKILYICYVDFKKVFDSKCRKGLWQINRHLRYSEKIVRLLKKLYGQTLSAVRIDEDSTEWF